MAKRQRVITLNYLPDGTYIFAWEVNGNIDPQHHITTVATIEEEFRLFCNAVRQCQPDLNLAVPLSDLLIFVGYTYAEIVMKCKSFFFTDTWHGSMDGTRELSCLKYSSRQSRIHGVKLMKSMLALFQTRAEFVLDGFWSVTAQFLRIAHSYKLNNKTCFEGLERERQRFWAQIDVLWHVKSS